MAAVKYDVSDVETGGGGQEPDPGLYDGEIVSITHRTKKADGKTAISDFEVVVDVGAEYTRKWYYVKLPDDPNWNKESHGWKLREFTDALGLPPNGSLDATKLSKQKHKVLAKIVADSSNNDNTYKGKIKNLFPPGKGATAAPSTNGASASAAADGGGGEGPYGREEIEGWPDEDIKGYAEELGVEIPTGRGAKAKLIDALVAAEEGAGSEAEAEADSATAVAEGLTEGIDEEFLAELKTDESHYSDWTDEDVIWLVNGLGIDGNVKTTGRGWKPKAIAGIVEFAQQVEGGGGEAETGDDAVVDKYDDETEWPNADLKAEIEERNEQGAAIEIAGRWTREKMIAALREDNKNAEPF
jgi:hypothetical protein